MRVYFDNCCYNRPFDNQLQNRIHDESFAILSLMQRECIVIIGSNILDLEISKMKDLDKQAKVKLLYSVIKEKVLYNSAIKNRAEELCEMANIKNMDSLHIAAAEYGHADVFLTTDDKLIKACQKIQLKMRVLNPIVLLGKVVTGDE